eukprot:GFUD01131625.1.p1 GENE.GFUD01131625.1~~GFUD01131625.1.p1  ORF type:complete len:144 (-),score=48.16 GFUD01131625.1:89-520(-)
MGFINKLFSQHTSEYQDMNDANANTPNQSFRARKSLAERKADVEAIKHKFPTKVPIIVERYKSEKSLPMIDKVKFLVPKELTMAQLATIVRNRLSLGSTETFFLFTSSGSMPALSISVSDLHRQSKDQDGFLYLTYTSQEVFG